MGQDDEREARAPSAEADRLVQRACGGDTDAFAELFRLTLPTVYASVFARCGDRALAEDLTSEAYLRALRNVGRFEGRYTDFQAWVVRIARNAFLDHVKSGRVRWEIVVDEAPVTVEPLDPAEQAVATVDGARLRRALEQLTPDQQEVVHLRFIQDLSIAEVAAVLGRAEGAVKALQFRAMRALAKILDA